MAEGVVIEGSKRSQWKIGSLIGAGEFGKVYALKRVSANNDNADDDANKWVIKVCPVAMATGKNSSKKSLAVKASNMLHYESMIYQNGLPLLQGIHVPILPNRDRPEPKYFGDESGFRYLVMERMKHPLLSIVPMLVPAKTAAAATKKIAIGPIAARLVSIIQAVHGKGHLVVDVKPENFMVAYGKKEDATPSCNDLAKRLRLIDLGLVQKFRAADELSASIVGTPLYASLNVHKGSTNSRRDDLEAVGYIIAELVIRLVAALESTTNEYEKGKIPTYLPWSTGNSDQAVGEAKEENVESKGSPFYARMGQGSASDIIYEYLTMVRKLSYEKKPNYDDLCKILLPLAVEAGTTKKAKASTAKAPRSPLVPCSVAPSQPSAVAKKPATNSATMPAPIRRSSRRKHGLDDEDDDFEFDEDAPRKKKAVLKMDKSKPVEVPTVPEHIMEDVEEVEPRPTKTRVKMDKSKPAEVVEEHIEELDDDDDFPTRPKKTRVKMDKSTPVVDTQDVEDMEIDSNDGDLNNDGIQAMEGVVPSKKKAGAIAIEVTEGSRKGQRFLLKAEETNVITIGSNQPRSAGSSKNSTESFPDDAKMAPRHFTLTLRHHRGNPRVEVLDLKSAQGTWVNLNRLACGKSTTVFPGDTIVAGATRFSVRRVAS